MIISLLRKGIFKVAFLQNPAIAWHFVRISPLSFSNDVSSMPSSTHILFFVCHNQNLITLFDH